MEMKQNKTIFLGLGFVVAFIIWTCLILTVDVQPLGQNGTNIGFATVNTWFHKLTGVHMGIYVITDWLGLVPVFICMIFGCLGLVQLTKRRSLIEVDHDILILGIYYIAVIMGYLVFEMIPINYRPILIEGRMEVSYPSSTTLLVLSVMPTLIFQAKRRIYNLVAKKTISVVTGVFTIFMVIGRLISGVHWVTDIIGGALLSAGLFYIYKACVLFGDKEIN